ncbi:MAG: TIR domain-containing protein [Cyanobacteria bacterium P01_B01_bin.77]
MGLMKTVAQYRLCLAYQQPKTDRLRRMAVVKPRANDIFISYASQDGDFVRLLDKAIREQGLDPWIDFDDIPDFQNFLNGDKTYQEHIKSGIVGADVFILVISKASLYSEITMQRLRLAQRLNKLIVLLGEKSGFQELNQQLSSVLPNLQYLDLKAPLVGQVFEQVARNIIHLQTYTRLLARAIEWDKQGRPQQYLLTPEDLKEVKKQKRWIETHKLGQQFQFTDVQQIFLETVDRVHETSEYLGKSPPDIFISYARSNKTFVENLSQALKNERWKIWLDSDRIPVASNWRDEAEEGIRYAHTVIFVICPDSLRSKNCQWEFEKAKEYKKRIIPVISHSIYDRDIFRAMGLSSIHYVSFVRQGQSFRQSLNQLLDALKVHIEDLRVYRQLLVKAYEWSDCERVDRLLMLRYEYQEIKRWYKKRHDLQNVDNRELEPLLPRQKEYIQASQRYLAVLRKRQTLAMLSVLGIFSGLSFLLLSTTFSEIRALVRSLDDLKGLDALVTGLQAGKRVQRNSLFVGLFRSKLRAKATTALHRTALKLREINRFEKHDGKVFSVTFSPDGQQLVSVGADKTVRFWDLGNPGEENSGALCEQNEHQEMGFHSTSVITLAYSSDQAYAATGDVNGAVKVWTCKGQLKKTLSARHQVRDSEGRPQARRVSRVQFSPGSQYLASAGTDGQVLLWTRSDDFRTFIRLEHSEQIPITTLVFSPNGKYLASADVQGRVYLWEINHRRQSLPSLKQINVFQYKVAPELQSLTALVFSPDSSLLAFAGVSGTIQVQDLKENSELLLSDHDGIVSSLVFSSDGRTLASASFDATVKLWNPREEKGKELIHTLRGHQGPVYRLVFGPQDDVLATGGADGIVRLWLREKGIQIDSFEGHEDEISSLAFAPKPSLGYATVLASSSDDGSIRLWDIDSPIRPLPHNSDVFDVTFRPDGMVIASGGMQTVRLWRLDGTSKSEIEFAKNIKVWAVDYSPDEKMLAAGGSNGQIRLWKPDFDTTMPIQVLEAHAFIEDAEVNDQGVLDLSFSHDGQWLASVGTDRTLKLWRVDGNQLYRYTTVEHSSDVTAVAFTADNRFVVTGTRAGSSSIKRGLTLWEMPGNGDAQVKLVSNAEVDEKHAGSILAIATQPSGQGLIASGGEDGKINLWDASGQWIKSLDDHSDPVTQVSFSANGRFLASSSEDGTVRLWTSRGDLISVLERHKRAVSSVEFAPENEEVLASSSADEDVLIWNLWDLEGVNLTARNQNGEILKMLVSDGCEAVSPFLENNYPLDAMHKKITDEVLFKEIKNLKDFCNGTSIFGFSQIEQMRYTFFTKLYSLKDH